MALEKEIEMERAGSEALDARLGRLERMVSDLRSQVERLQGAVATMRSTPSPVPQQVFCPHCRGGNPPANITCMWCHRPLQVVPTPPDIAPRGSASQAAVPVGTAATFSIPAPPVTPTTPSYANAQAASGPTSTGTTSRQQPDILKSGEFWLSRVGIVLFLLGVGFLFKYSVDQGWLTEWVRVAIGFVVGTALLMLGSTMRAERRALKYVLLGGSIATFYVTGFAAYQLFHLVAYELAFAFMVAVTVLSFSLALGHNQSLLSIVGVAGGLATPFVLGDRSGGVISLVAYSCLVAAGGVAVYFFRGWRGLLWTTFSGTWLALMLGEAGTMSGVDDDTGTKWALQAGAIFCLLIFWAVPVVRETLRTNNPDRWALPALDEIRNRGTKSLIEAQVHALVVVAPLVTLGLSWIVWESSVPGEVLGAGTLVVAALFGAVAWGLRQSQGRLAHTHAMMGMLLLSLALVQLLDGNILMVALAVEAAALHFVAHRLSDRGMAIMGHVLWGCVALWVGAGFAYDMIVALLGGERTGQVPVWNEQALTYLAVIALAVAASFVVRSSRAVVLYRLAAHLAVLALLWRELSALQNGNAYVTIAWGVWACALLFAGIRLDRNPPLLYAGAGTLVLLVAKLFLVDLSALEAIWRVLIFLGIGGLFLVLSYYFQNVMKRAPRLGKETEGP